MTNSTVAVHANVETPSTQPTTVTPLKSSTPMEGIETTAQFTFLVTIQVYDFHAASDTTYEQSSVGKTIKEWISTLLLRSDDRAIIKTKDGTVVKLTEYPDTEGSARELLQYDILNSNRRNVSVMLSIETDQTFRELKEPMMPLLKRKNLYMTRHLFKTKHVNIAKVGFLINKNPRDTYRETFRDYVETQMRKILNDMSAVEQVKYATEFISDFEATPRDDLEIRVQECRPTWNIDNQNYSTEALAIFCPRPDMYLIMDLITKIFPGTKRDEFDDDPIIKFVPFSTPYNHSISNAEQTYVSLLQEQNQFLQDHVGIPIGGLSYEAMQHCAETGMTMDTTLYHTKLFTAIEPTSLVNKTGKWIFCTTRQKSAAALEYIETMMPQLHRQVPKELHGTYPMCPTPRRLTRSPIRTAYMVNIAIAAKHTVTKNQSRNLQNAPRTNAWRSGPPTLKHDQDTSTATSKMTYDSSTVMSKIDAMQATMDAKLRSMTASIQHSQTTTDSQISKLSLILEGTIASIQLDKTPTANLLDQSHELSDAKMTQLKNDIVLDLKPLIQQAIETAVPTIIRNHIDSTIGPVIRSALASMNLLQASDVTQLLQQINQTNASSSSSGSPTRKVAKVNGAHDTSPRSASLATHPQDLPPEDIEIDPPECS